METKKYDSSQYDRPDGLPVDNCIFTITKNEKTSTYKVLPELELKILLIKRRIYDEPRPDYPHQGKWALPGGFSQRDESIEEAAKRELKEETNVGDDVYIEQYSTIYYPGRDPRGWMPTTVFVALVRESLLKNRVAGDDAQEVSLFSIDEIREMDLAFDHKEIILGNAKKIGREKHGTLGMIQEAMLETTVAKEFLNNEFTINELLQVIQTVVPEFKVQKPNFMKKVVGSKSRQSLLVESLNNEGVQKLSDKYSQRPARLFKFNENFEPRLSIYNSTMI